MPKLNASISKSLADTIKAHLKSSGTTLERLVNDALWNELGGRTPRRDGSTFADHLRKLQKAARTPTQNAESYMATVVRPEVTVSDAMSMSEMIDKMGVFLPADLVGSDRMELFVRVSESFKAAYLDCIEEFGVSADVARQAMRADAADHVDDE